MKKEKKVLKVERHAQQQQTKQKLKRKAPRTKKSKNRGLTGLFPV